jgi:uncharacterized protein
MSILLRLAAPLAALVLSLGAAVAQQAAPAPAQNAAPTLAPSHLAAAREVAVSSGIVRSIDVIPPQLYERIREQLIARPELTKDLNEVMEALKPEMELQKQKVVNDIALIYARALTEAELKDVIAFFKSASGKKYVESQPEVLDEMVREMQLWSQELAEYVMVRIRAEMQKRGFQLQ